jgi:hypothetical protein
VICDLIPLMHVQAVILAAAPGRKERIEGFHSGADNKKQEPSSQIPGKVSADLVPV